MITILLYSKTYWPLYDDYEAKCKTLVDDYKAKYWQVFAAVAGEA